MTIYFVDKKPRRYCVPASARDAVLATGEANLGGPETSRGGGEDPERKERSGGKVNGSDPRFRKKTVSDVGTVVTTGVR